MEQNIIVIGGVKDLLDTWIKGILLFTGIVVLFCECLKEKNKII